MYVIRSHTLLHIAVMQFLILDDMTEATNIDMVEGRRERTGKVKILYV